MFTLLQAFRTLGPLIGRPQVDQPRSGAARLLFQELQAFAAANARLRRWSAEQRADAVAIVLLRLVQVGPRAVRLGDPDSDEGVRRYLQVALHHACLDLDRSQHAAETVPIVPGAEPPAPNELDAEQLVDRSRALAMLQRAQRDLRDVLIPWVMRGRRAAAARRLAETIDELVRIHAGEPQPDRAVARDGQAPRDPKSLRRMRYARYQQAHRALQALLQGVDQMQAAGALPESRCCALRAVIADLRLGHSQEPL